MEKLPSREKEVEKDWKQERGHLDMREAKQPKQFAPFIPMKNNVELPTANKLQPPKLNSPWVFLKRAKREGSIWECNFEMHNSTSAHH